MSSVEDFTLAQANDLARYFLGPQWRAELTGAIKRDRLSLEGPHTLIEADSWQDLFRAAGVPLPIRPQYIAAGLRVMLVDRAICTAVSNTLAKRIAAALNAHTPDRRGI
jgi:hypothetical protein